MPERLATTDPYKQVTEMVGSGPYRYKADERVAGSLVVYERNTKYVPRPNGTPDGTAGPKIAHIDRIEWHIIPDPATVAAAVQRGEIDWWLVPQADLLPLLRKQRSVKVENIVPTGFIATHALQPAQSAVRQSRDPSCAARRGAAVRLHDRHGRHRRGSVARAMWLLHTQHPARQRCRHGRLITSKRDLAKVKRDLDAAGYKGEKVVVLTPTDIASAKALADITADTLKHAGMNVDAQAMDWATLVGRRAKMDPVEQGGWSIFHTSWSGLDQINPAGHIFLRAQRQGCVAWLADQSEARGTA